MKFKQFLKLILVDFGFNTKIVFHITKCLTKVKKTLLLIILLMIAIADSGHEIIQRKLLLKHLRPDLCIAIK